MSRQPIFMSFELLDLYAGAVGFVRLVGSTADERDAGPRRRRDHRHRHRLCLRAALRGRRDARAGASAASPQWGESPRSVLFGAINAQLYFGIRTLAFVYPFVVESAGVRSLESQHLRTQAELSTLRLHLEPHFLVNTLNAIAGLVTEEPREARHLLVCLGDLLRDAVQETSETQRLDKQIAWLRRYAHILEARHHGVLRFGWDVAPESAGAMIPRMLLQPLVENAVKHGALRRPDGAGEVVIARIRGCGWSLVCIIEDNGPGMHEADVREGAFGLQSVRRRLELEASHASLRFESSSTGTRAIVEIAGAGE